jgi:ABC-2 type transport system ATP-binding protein
MVCNRVIIINRGRLAALDTPINLAEGALESRTVQVDVEGRPAGVLQTLKGITGVAQAALVPQEGAMALNANGDGARMSAADANLPDGQYSYRVESHPGRDLRPDIASAIVGAGYRLLELRGLRLSLEDVFLQVVARGAETVDYEDEPYDGAGMDDRYAGDYGDYEEDEMEEEAMASAPSAPSARSTVRIKTKRVRR